ncbi:MAG: selenide, water dikinase SelD, partial [SAR324 cluster bacterium]|nr:selenide, water dikinase SelD [SAR324 cluster bacterium]
VYRITDDIAIVMTADFITPPVDDPYLFGQIAAANALSDVYAMGGRPVACLNLVGFPSGDLPPETLQSIIAGALSKIEEAGAVLAGGHSTEDEEPKFGLSVTGIVHPDKIWRNSGAQVGDRLILTKPIGSGVLINGQRKGWVPEEAMNACVAQITTLNMAAAEVMAEYSIHAATDVTGFGLAGHGYEVAHGAGLTLRMDLDKIPVMDAALDMYKKGVTTGVNKANRELCEGNYRFEKELPAWHQEIVFDPQTAGGLLVAVPESQAAALLADLHKAGVSDAAEIGWVREREAELLVFF